MAPPGKGIDYSKWDNIADSDDEDAAQQPRTQVGLFVASCKTICSRSCAACLIHRGAKRSIGQLQKSPMGRADRHADVLVGGASQILALSRT